MVDSVTSSTSASTSSGLSGTGLGKEDFLKLLVAQLSRQDPLNPQDGSAFVAQLAQFSSVEQLVNIRGGLDNLALAQQASTSAEVVGFIGRDVLAVGDGLHLGASGTATLEFELAGPAETVSVEVRDAKGKVVRTFDAGPHTTGVGTTTFDGKDANGIALPSGEYTFRVTAKDAEGDTVASQTHMGGKVTGVTFEAGYPQLILEGGRKLSLSDVIRVGEPVNTATLTTPIALASRTPSTFVPSTWQPTSGADLVQSIPTRAIPLSM